MLAGVIASSLFNAIGSLLKYTADPQDKLPEITYWLMGSFTSATYKKLLIGSPLILIGIVVIYLLRWRLNILSLSEDEAKASGINLKRTQMIFILASTVITASAVSTCGQVGWIGLLVPHCARMLVGSNNRYVVPISLSLGASFMILIDTLSRTISVIELPLSILTAISRSFLRTVQYMPVCFAPCSCVCSRLISPSVSSWHKQDNTSICQSGEHIQHRTPYNS